MIDKLSDTFGWCHTHMPSALNYALAKVTATTVSYLHLQHLCGKYFSLVCIFSFYAAKYKNIKHVVGNMQNLTADRQLFCQECWHYLMMKLRLRTSQWGTESKSMMLLIMFLVFFSECRLLRLCLACCQQMLTWPWTAIMALQHLVEQSTQCSICCKFIKHSIGHATF